MEKNQCSCGGENPRCFKCDGRGWIDPEEKRGSAKLPPVLPDPSLIDRGFRLSVTRTKQKSMEWPPIAKSKSGPVNNGKSLSCKVGGVRQCIDAGQPKNLKDQFKRSRGEVKPFEKSEYLLGINAERTLRLTRAELEVCGWLKPQEHLPASDLFRVHIQRIKNDNGNFVLIVNVSGETQSRKSKQTKKHYKKKTKGKPYKGESTGRIDCTKGNTAMEHAFTRAVLADTGMNERELDATKDYWRIRDNGQFGSYPIHDDYDE